MICLICQMAFESHDFYRGHAYCWGEGAGRYRNLNYLICRDLWEAAEDLINPEDAHLAFGVWTMGSLGSGATPAIANLEKATL